MNEHEDQQMKDWLSQGYAGTEPVDLVERTWQEGRRRRFRRGTAIGVTVTGLLAASAATAIALGGWPGALQSPDHGTGGPAGGTGQTSTPGPSTTSTGAPSTTGRATTDPTAPTTGTGQAPPGADVSLSNGIGLTVPAGWLAVPVVDWVNATTGDAETLSSVTCVAPDGETGPLGACPGVQISTGVWPVESMTEPTFAFDLEVLCQVETYQVPDLLGDPQVEDVEIGSGLTARRATWAFSCDGASHVATTWSVTDAGSAGGLTASALDPDAGDLAVLDGLRTDLGAAVWATRTVAIDDLTAPALTGEVFGHNFGKVDLPFEATGELVTLIPDTMTVCLTEVEKTDPRQIANGLSRVDCAELLGAAGADAPEGTYYRVAYEQDGDRLLAITQQLARDS